VIHANERTDDVKHSTKYYIHTYILYRLSPNYKRLFKDNNLNLNKYNNKNKMTTIKIYFKDPKKLFTLIFKNL